MLASWPAIHLRSVIPPRRRTKPAPFAEPASASFPKRRSPNQQREKHDHWACLGHVGLSLHEPAVASDALGNGRAKEGRIHSTSSPYPAGESSRRPSRDPPGETNYRSRSDKTTGSYA